MAADDDLDDIVNVRNLEFEDNHNGDSYMLFPNQDGSYMAVLKEIMRRALFHIIQ